MSHLSEVKMDILGKPIGRLGPKDMARLPLWDYELKFDDPLLVSWEKGLEKTINDIVSRAPGIGNEAEVKLVRRIWRGYSNPVREDKNTICVTAPTTPTDIQEWYQLHRHIDSAATNAGHPKVNIDIATSAALVYNIASSIEDSHPLAQAWDRLSDRIVAQVLPADAGLPWLLCFPARYGPLQHLQAPNIPAVTRKPAVVVLVDKHADINWDVQRIRLASLIAETGLAGVRTVIKKGSVEYSTAPKDETGSESPRVCWPWAENETIAAMRRNGWLFGERLPGWRDHHKASPIGRAFGPTMIRGLPEIRGHSGALGGFVEVRHKPGGQWEKMILSNWNMVDGAMLKDDVLQKGLPPIVGHDIDAQELLFLQEGITPADTDQWDPNLCLVPLACPPPGRVDKDVQDMKNQRMVAQAKRDKLRAATPLDDMQKFDLTRAESDVKRLSNLIDRIEALKGEDPDLFVVGGLWAASGKRQVFVNNGNGNIPRPQATDAELLADGRSWDNFKRPPDLQAPPAPLTPHVAPHLDVGGLPHLTRPRFRDVDMLAAPNRPRGQPSTPHTPYSTSSRRRRPAASHTTSVHGSRPATASQSGLEYPQHPFDAVFPSTLPPHEPARLNALLRDADASSGNVMHFSARSGKTMGRAEGTTVLQRSWFAKPDDTFGWQVTKERMFDVIPRGYALPVYGGDSGSLLLARGGCGVVGLVFGNFEDGHLGLYSDINEVFADIKTVTGCDAIRIASENPG